MLKLVIPEREHFNESTNTFVTTKEQILKLEHSLLSISKWESKWEVPFLFDDPENPKTDAMLIDYMRCMTLNSVPDDIYDSLDQESLEKIMEYIKSKQSATTIREVGNNKPNNQIITSELIYYWMVAAQIPMECERWHINRLLKLIKIYSIENDPDKNKKSQVGKRQMAQDRAALNAKRLAKYKTKG